jgi:hypothetical protein
MNDGDGARVATLPGLVLEDTRDAVRALDVVGGVSGTMDHTVDKRLCRLLG